MDKCLSLPVFLEYGDSQQQVTIPCNISYASLRSFLIHTYPSLSQHQSTFTLFGTTPTFPQASPLKDDLTLSAFL